MPHSIVAKTDIPSALRTFSTVQGSPVRRLIEIGDYLIKGVDGPQEFSYLVDDTNVYREVPGINNPIDTLAAIHQHFPVLDNPDAQIRALFQEYGVTEGNRLVVPFSHVVRNNFGNCTERSGVFQLAHQKDSEVYFVRGMEGTGEIRNNTATAHDYNIMVLGNSNQTILVDASPSFSRSEEWFPMALEIQRLIRYDLGDGKAACMLDPGDKINKHFNYYFRSSTTSY